MANEPIKRYTVEKGTFEVLNDTDSDYAGIDVEFIPKNEEPDTLSNPRVRMEFDDKGQLRILVWNDKNKEDYSTVIIPNHKI